MPRTSRGREFLAVLYFAKVSERSGRGQHNRGGRMVCVPSVGDDDVVEWGVSAAEARETDFDDHVGIGVGGPGVEGWTIEHVRFRPRYRSQSFN